MPDRMSVALPVSGADNNPVSNTASDRMAVHPSRNRRISLISTVPDVHRRLEVIDRKFVQSALTTAPALPFDLVGFLRRAVLCGQRTFQRPGDAASNQMQRSDAIASACSSSSAKRPTASNLVYSAFLLDNCQPCVGCNPKQHCSAYDTIFEKRQSPLVNT